MDAKWMRVVIAAATLTAAPGFAAETHPARPIRVLAGGAAGGPIDILARVVGQKLAKWAKVIKDSGARAD